MYLIDTKFPESFQQALDFHMIMSSFLPKGGAREGKLNLQVGQVSDRSAYVDRTAYGPEVFLKLNTLLTTKASLSIKPNIKIK